MNKNETFRIYNEQLKESHQKSYDGEIYKTLYEFMKKRNCLGKKKDWTTLFYNEGEIVFKYYKHQADEKIVKIFMDEEKEKAIFLFQVRSNVIHENSMEYRITDIDKTNLIQCLEKTIKINDYPLDSTNSYSNEKSFEIKYITQDEFLNRDLNQF